MLLASIVKLDLVSSQSVSDTHNNNLRSGPASRNSLIIHIVTFQLIRPPVRSNGRTYKMLVMFLFFPTRNLRDPSADHRETLPYETLPYDWKLVLFYNPTSKIRGGALPQKNLGAKNMQNFGPFCTTSDFDRAYLRNGSRHPKSEN